MNIEIAILSEDAILARLLIDSCFQGIENPQVNLFH